MDFSIWTETAQNLREKGNDHYKAQQYEEALCCYIQGLKIGSVGDEEKAILHKNSAQCYLKLGQNKKAEISASIGKFLFIVGLFLGLML